MPLQVSASWEGLLLKSAREHGTSWLHALHLGIIAAERLDVPRALEHLRDSIQRRPTARRRRGHPGWQGQRTEHSWSCPVTQSSTCLCSAVETPRPRRVCACVLRKVSVYKGSV